MSEKLCRICLEEGAIYPIFKNKNEDHSIYDKLSLCVREKIEDIDGYPRNICEMCKDTLELAYNFVNKYKESCKLLQNGLLVVKAEDVHDTDFSYNEVSEIEIDIAKGIKKETDDFDENFNSENEALVKLEPIRLKLKTRNKKKEIKKNKCLPKNLKKKVARNSTNRIAASILEGDFTWTGEKWCNSNKAQSTVTKNISIPIRIKHVDIKREAKLKKQPAPFKLCDVCGEVFKNQDKLSVHKKNIHFKKPAKCTECSRILSSDYYLNRHMLRKHGKERNFMCSVCGKGFCFKGELTSHHRNVHNKHLKEKKVWTCKFCNKTYKCAKSTIVHERSVHTGERPAVCSICNSRFFHEDYLKEHMRLHTGETPYKCPICGRGYAQRCNMKSHLRIHRISELDAATLSTLRPNYLKRLKV